MKQSSKIIFAFLVFFLVINPLFSQKNAKGNVIVDSKGVMRWEKTNQEVKGFGVNYTVPFAHAYRSAKRLGIDPKEAIDNDVYHFSRLGFDLYRVHVWDTEISDTLGNLIDNEHLNTLDYLVWKLKQAHINAVITPIAFWGNGWPEPDTKSPGFSTKYGKSDCLTNPDAIKAQKNYLEQFLNHVNPYKGIAYKEDPNIIAFEISNEPHHKGEGEKVTDFIKGMVKAMKKTGTQKPIFYNMSHAVQFMEDYFKGHVQGGTFQWYPTGLGYGKELSGNLLPNVNDYNMPFDSIFKTYLGAKLVYEFDAADVGRSYIYPAMSRSFREAGIQIATHFAYDPTFLAPYNTEYNTHYMNLNYAPQKALALKICSEVFHNIPMYSDFGLYPNNTRFSDFKVDYKNDLAEYNSETKFFYTNTTNSSVKNESKLKEIAGFGNSSVISYDGLGAYFLDKISKGVWRLEVMPDAVWVDNLFGRNSPNKTVAVIKWKTHSMQLHLEDLGSNFNVVAINKENEFVSEVKDKSFQIRPGTYIISKQGAAKKWSKNDDFKTYKLNDFYAPKSNVNQLYFKHAPIVSITENSELKIEVQCMAPENPEEINLTGFNSNGKYFNQQLKYLGNYKYETIIPSNYIKKGFVNYNIIVKQKDGIKITHPSGKTGNLYAWDFYDRTSYKITVVPKEYPMYLFNAIEDTDDLVKTWMRSFKLVPTKNFGEAAYQMNVEKLFVQDEENSKAKPIYDYSFKHFILDQIKDRKTDLLSKEALIFKGYALNNKPCKLQIAFVLDDGSAYGKVIDIETISKDYTIKLDELKPVRTVILPRPYPSFLPYYLEHNIVSDFDISRIESLQFSIGPEIHKNEINDPHGIAMISVYLK
ncbi:MAG: hypothetical protein COZ17_13160 [Flavobacteriaceae bacterium CG_4_10_14_3_um_filter_33_47]|nr:MAG: hypothetical protein COZ17_13160 [Flavobacteriaceae bacterium CG_4_10_14_3_um_filter_33_47]